MTQYLFISVFLSIPLHYFEFNKYIIFILTNNKKERIKELPNPFFLESIFASFANLTANYI
jgi:hypothetical protein